MIILMVIIAIIILVIIVGEFFLPFPSCANSSKQSIVLFQRRLYATERGVVTFAHCFVDSLGII